MVEEVERLKFHVENSVENVENPIETGISFKQYGAKSESLLSNLQKVYGKMCKNSEKAVEKRQDS